MLLIKKYKFYEFVKTKKMLFVSNWVNLKIQWLNRNFFFSIARLKKKKKKSYKKYQ